MKWTNALRFQKNSLNPIAASHNTTSSYTATQGFLEHLPCRRSLYYKGPILQTIIPFSFLVPPHMPLSVDTQGERNALRGSRYMVSQWCLKYKHRRSLPCQNAPYPKEGPHATQLPDGQGRVSWGTLYEYIKKEPISFGQFPIPPASLLGLNLNTCLSPSRKHMAHLKSFNWKNLSWQLLLKSWTGLRNSARLVRHLGECHYIQGPKGKREEMVLLQPSKG